MLRYCLSTKHCIALVEFYLCRLANPLKPLIVTSSWSSNQKSKVPYGGFADWRFWIQLGERPLNFASLKTHLNILPLEIRLTSSG